MAFEESPRFDGHDVVSRPSWRNWIARNRRWLFMLAALCLLADGLAVSYFLFPSVLHLPPGGLDGCMVSTDGRPLQATVRIGGSVRSTDVDGCFFFPALGPGPQVISVKASSGETITQIVRIYSDQAVGLGTMVLP